MGENRFYGRELLPQLNYQLATQIEARLVDQSTGLHVVFESRVIDWPASNPVEPITVARHDYERDGPEPGTPAEVVQHLNESGWERFVWVPVGVGHGDRFRFTIRYAHELQHYRQLLGSDSLSKARAFLSRVRAAGHRPAIKSEMFATEFDADVVGFDVFEAIHGEAALRELVESDAGDQKMRDFYDRVLRLRARFKAWQTTGTL